MTELPDGLRRWCALSGPSKVIDAVRTRARRGYNTESGVLRIELTTEQRREIGKLLGVSWAITDAPVNLASLGRALVSHGLTARELVELLDGESIVNERLSRADNLAVAAAERTAAAGELTRLGIATDTVELWLSDAGLPRAGKGELLGFTTQGRFLLNCGIANMLADADLPDRAAGHRLIAEHEMGELFKVIALHRGDFWDAVGFREGDRTERL